MSDPVDRAAPETGRRPGDRRTALTRVPGRPFDAAALHRSILSGLVTSIGRLRDKDEKGEKGETHVKGEYVGPRGVRFAIFPGSVLHRSEAPWIMAAELVETTRLYARTCARIRSDWVERVAPHLVRREHFEPHWRAAEGQVAAFERVSINGLVLVPRRRVPYGPIDAKAARDIFIQSALVEEQIRTDGAFLDHNRELIERLEVEETKRRQRGGSIEPTARFDFYDARIPDDVHSTPSFESWRRSAERGRPRLLFMTEEDLRRGGSARTQSDEFPDSLEFDGLRLPLEYVHEPGDLMDGVTVTVPIAALPQVSEERIGWLVPGLLPELVAALIRTLPKRLRVRFVPAAEYADGALESLRFGDGSLTDRLARHLHRLTGTPIAPADFRLERLPAHLRMNIRIVDSDGGELGGGRDLAELRRALGGRAHESLRGASSVQSSDAPSSPPSAALTAPIPMGERLRDFPTDGLAERVEVEQGGMRVVAYPALIDEGDGASVRLMPTASGAARCTRDGVRRLLLIAAEDEIRPMLEFLPGSGDAGTDGSPSLDRLALLHAPLGGCAPLEDALALRIAEVAFLPLPGTAPPRTPSAFAALRDAGRPRLWQAGVTVAGLADRVLTLRQEVMRTLESPLPSTWEVCAADVRAQLDALLPAGFLATTPWAWLVHVPRYLAAILQRFETLRGGGQARDFDGTVEIRRHQSRLDAHTQRHPSELSEGTRLGDAMEQYRWLIEEFRVSLFAQKLRTSLPVSAERLDRHWRDAIELR